MTRNTPKPELLAVFLHSAEIERYSYPDYCPFKTNRAVSTRKTAVSMGFFPPSFTAEIVPDSADREVLLEFHTGEYLDALVTAPEKGPSPYYLAMGIGTEDCPIFEGMYDYARLVCGASLKGAELILAGKTLRAFNPSGGFHHASPSTAAGFCYINDIVLSCMKLANAGKRVAAIDLDVHHGEGVQDAFYDRDDVLYMSFHQNGDTLFPGSGAVRESGRGKGEGYTVNVPLPPGTYDEVYIDAFRQVAVPLLGAYDPDIIVLELGMDGLAGDPLADLDLTNNAYAAVIEHILDLEKPVLATGGGGYNVDNTARGWALAWQILSGSDITDAASLGGGGVLLENTDWSGGLRDRRRAPTSVQRKTVEPAMELVISEVIDRIFPVHGLVAGERGGGPSH